MKPVAFPVSDEVAFDYLVEPANRPLWQSSLRRVADVSAPPVRVGSTWTDVTVPGLRPRMRLADQDRPHWWLEEGVWRGVHAWLRLDFRPSAEGCLVTPTFRVAAPLVGPVITQLAAPAVRGDLRRAARQMRSAD